ncbi:MAG: glycine cleavage system aminomethyltransferase GcvT [Rickettsiales bacterium]
MKSTKLNSVHRKQGAKMVEFAGYDMPVQYPDGMLKEHEWVRSGNIGLFDVSHMGQFIIEGKNVADFLSNITPTDFNLSTNFLAKYTVLTNENGGIIDDLIITKINDEKFFIVLNAGCKEKDAKWISQNLPSHLKFQELANRSLIAIQGENSAKIINNFLANGNVDEIAYMNLAILKLKNGEEIFVSRTGYTGEDGFEISISNENVEQFWLDLCNNENVKPIGLGARDSLRLEMGYPLYGHDLNDTTSPIEASIGWVVSKTNQNFIGCNRVLAEKANGASRKRMGVKLLDRGIAREGTEIKKDGKIIGLLTSGGFSPNLKISIGQGYFNPSEIKIGDNVVAIVRDREIPAQITSFVFVEPKTKSIKKSS